MITPLPTCVPHQLALDILHSHSEIITLNPLVLSHRPIRAPRDAIADEYYSTWYEITEQVQYIPGLGKLGAGKISFKGCFQNVEWGLRTHMYAPLGIDLQSKWRIGGDAEERDRADGAPQSGLYLHEEVQIDCNRALVSFVKGQLKAASKVLVDRLIRKAELLDAGVLQGVVEDGKLMTFNPADLSDKGALQRGYSMRGSQSGGRRRSSGQGLGSPIEAGSVSNAYAPQYGRERGKSFPVELAGDFYHMPAEAVSPRTEVYQELPANDQLANSSRLGTGYGVELDGTSPRSQEYRDEGLPYRPYSYRSPEKG
ncbi:uncharacterized protein N7515_006555 [Penicillium bovifimosum]|uniref:DUF7053 domain-containing protein n=1 Tax=Penicillium bovifimosum TaxID=126998 RepID=A0A9W9GV62_9EURO|nr:uncharacterized protein N7515_006555 [Penicillium bovifimosum]KAJ5130516.1 hypothetical protein N7515_006555 [Penicillium bovifimosum]